MHDEVVPTCKGIKVVARTVPCIEINPEALPISNPAEPVADIVPATVPLLVMLYTG